MVDPAEDPTAASNGRLTAELITSLWRSVEVQMSPDGRRAAWTAKRWGNEGDQDESAIWVPTWAPGGQDRDGSSFSGLSPSAGRD